MRSLLATVLALSWTLSAVADDGATRFPYSAFVAGETAAVRSGPGEQYYPVMNLAQGNAVEVWRHDPGGWCAVRPPEGSFSWISGDFVETNDVRRGVIVGHQVNVRVGTQFSELRDVVQMQLNAGDAVDILDARLLSLGERMTTWYKIAPPAGEFRWLHESQLTSDAAGPAPAAVQATALQATALVDLAVEDKATINPLAHVDALPEGASAEATLAELEIALSAMVAAEPTAWHFTEMKRRAEAVLQQSETAIERSRARQFLSKLSRFEDIAKRFAAMAELRTQTTAIDQAIVTTTAPAVRVEPVAALDGSTDTSRYDGVGRLTQIVKTADGGSAYALTDERGETTAYVLAAPGVNLRQYVGLNVGVNGIRGYKSDERMPQLTAKRVDILSNRAVASREDATRR